MTFRRLLRSKIHGATITHADLKYEGSITISPELLQASNIAPYEAVWVWNVTNGNRFETYAIEGEPHARSISVNGAAARLVQPGDKVIIAAFGFLPEEAVSGYEPTVVFVDEQNKIKEKRKEIAGPKLVKA